MMNRYIKDRSNKLVPSDYWVLLEWQRLTGRSEPVHIFPVYVTFNGQKFTSGLQLRRYMKLL